MSLQEIVELKSTEAALQVVERVLRKTDSVMLVQCWVCETCGMPHTGLAPTSCDSCGAVGSLVHHPYPCREMGSRW